MSKRSHPRVKAKRLAEVRVEILWEQAKKAIKSGRPEIARQQMFSARKIAQRTRTKLPQHINRRICRSCGSILVPGDNCRVRVRHNRSKHLAVTCLNCGRVKRYDINK
ncbi:MAG: hypothetical protein AM326_11140 [Candidatus Thorarchaeota archaeon SMTZ-45]|nr:MAG: hypothetical protein AM326_11140 [Candidatus Thorarchaeota archaeon SMTZ-45]